MARADASKPNMGLTSWAGAKPRKSDVAIAKNYLAVGELDTLNRIVNAYLEFAELQAMSRRPMYMLDWAAKLDDFLRLGDREVLTHPGTVSHEDAVSKAEQEYERFAKRRAVLPALVEEDFARALEAVKQLEQRRPVSARSRKKC